MNTESPPSDPRLETIGDQAAEDHSGTPLSHLMRASPTDTAHAGKPFPHLRYCIRCCMPQTQEGIEFDELGVCQACQSAEQKIHIDWAERERDLRKIFETAKANAGNNYDCIIPISGGKDSTFQLYVLTQVYGLKPLAVTFSHNWYSETGWYNLQNSLEQFNVDHIMFTPNRSLVNRIAKHSLAGIGDSCWHCHAGVGAFPLQAAVRFNIPLLVWGESIAESSGRASYKIRCANLTANISPKSRPNCAPTRWCATI
jgi:N-acetyl sugar amidotransferase